MPPAIFSVEEGALVNKVSNAKYSFGLSALALIQFLLTARRIGLLMG